ncbi:MAG TPA: ABC transporter permease [Candidatus Eisenbacteria bacterium]|nr:ABC transporter permease [Candidatus Eisenbacteria bacterium]
MGRLSYLFREAWRGLWHHRSLTFTAFLALVGALLVPCVFLVVLVNTLSAVHTLGDRREMLVFLHDDIADSTRQDVARRLGLVARQINYVSKDEAWDEMAKELGGDELLRAVNENPLPASFRVKLRPAYLHYAAMDSISQAMTHVDGVEEVQYGGPWIRRLDQFLQTLRTTGIGIAGIIGLVVLFVVANAIRLTVVARRDIHRVMVLLGASRRFVRTPLLFEGALVSVLASGTALGITYLIVLGLANRLVILPSFLPWRWMLSFVGAAALLGILGSALALARVGREDRTR